MKKILSLLLVLVLCFTLASGCTKNDPNAIPKEVKTDNDKLDKEIVLTVGKTKYTQADFNFAYKLIYDNISQTAASYGNDWFNLEVEENKTIGDFIKENAMMQLKQLAVVQTIAEDNGIKVNDEIRNLVEEERENIIKNNYQTAEAYKEFLASSRTTDKAVRTYLTMYEIYNRIYTKMSAKGGRVYVEDKEIEADFFKELEDMLRVKHILVSTMEQTDETGTPIPARSDEDAQALVKEIISKLDKGEDFDKLIDEYNEDPGMTSGNFYLFGEGEMVAEFESASKELKIGTYTKEGVKTDYGYHIIKRYDMDTQMPEFEQYRQSRMQENMAKIINDKLDKTTVKEEKKIIDNYIKEWTSVLNAELNAEMEKLQNQSEFFEDAQSAE